jgi:hypothetical protein
MNASPNTDITPEKMEEYFKRLFAMQASHEPTAIGLRIIRISRNKRRAYARLGDMEFVGECNPRYARYLVGRMCLFEPMKRRIPFVTPL